MTKIKDLRKGDIVRLPNGHEAWVENIITDLEWYDDVAKVYVADIDQQGMLYDKDDWELVRDYTIEEDGIV